MRVMLTAFMFVVLAGAAPAAPASGPTLAMPPAGLSHVTMRKSFNKLQELVVELERRGRPIVAGTDCRLMKADDLRASVGVAGMSELGI